MIMRHLWFFVGLLLAVLAGLLAPGFMPTFLNWISAGVLPALYVELFNESSILRFAAVLALGGMVFFLLVFISLAVLDGVQIFLARRRLQAEQAMGPGTLAPDAFVTIMARHTPFDELARTYCQYLHGRKEASNKSGRRTVKYVAEAPAASLFGPQKTLEPMLYRWVFDPLPGALAGFGAVMAGLTLVWSLEPGAAAIDLNTLRPGLIALVLLSGTGLIIAAVKRGTLTLRRQQMEQLCHDIDLIYPPSSDDTQLADLRAASREASTEIVKAVQSLSKDLNETVDATLKEWQERAEKNHQSLESRLVAGLEEALREPMARLTEVAERTAQEQSEQSREALQAVLDQFLDGLNRHFSDQTQALRSAIEETQQAAQSMSAAYEQSLTHHREQVAQDLGAHAESFEKTAANFEALQGVIENLITLVSPMLRQIIDNQESLMNALDQEASSSKVIGRAASELSTAAQASRDTVERFVTLAERMREANKAVAARGSAAPIDKDTIDELRTLRNSVLSEPLSQQDTPAQPADSPASTE